VIAIQCQGKLRSTATNHHQKVFLTAVLDIASKEEIICNRLSKPEIGAPNGTEGKAPEMRILYRTSQNMAWEKKRNGKARHLSGS
jgi:hypothetical protein